ncbi:MAG TPA: hypothetical protein H9922_10385 [Candidatus Phocaeicola caecigallinarum]|nr:hypothetical protein [Candidatus Phocaeicola caecigallinarum]
MNRISFFLLLILIFPLQSTNANDVSEGIPVDIYVSIRDPFPSKGPIMRSPPKMPNDYQLVSSYKNFLSNQIVSYLKNKKPEILERYSEIQLSEFLKRNMVV